LVLPGANVAKATRFERFILPGLAFKAVIIGGGYATGRELAEFFGPSGARGGLYGMLVAMLVWSVIAALTFLYARAIDAQDYRSFFRHLLGPFWPLFELLLLSLFLLTLAVFSAAAGAIGGALFGWPSLVGQLLLLAAIVAVVAFGSNAVEKLFGYVSIVLYATYALFLVLSLWRFGDRISASLSVPAHDLSWIGGGLAYSGYNIVGAVVILYIIRHFTSNRDAAIAGVLCGPLAIAPAMLFFLSLAAFPAAMAAELPSDYLLRALDVPLFPYFYQIMIFLALLESGAGAVHALNERIAHVYERNGRQLTRGLRAATAVAFLLLAGFVAERIGLVDLIAGGYRYISYAMLAIFVLPLLTLGSWRLLKWRRQPPPFLEPSKN
jgi:uncharacterized membrane protein YkvI